MSERKVTKGFHSRPRVLRISAVQGAFQMQVTPEIFGVDFKKCSAHWRAIVQSLACYRVVFGVLSCSLWRAIVQFLACYRVVFGVLAYNQGTTWCTLSRNSKQKSPKMPLQGPGACKISNFLGQHAPRPPLENALADQFTNLFVLLAYHFEELGVPSPACRLHGMHPGDGSTPTFLYFDQNLWRPYVRRT